LPGKENGPAGKLSFAMPGRPVPHKLKFFLSGFLFTPQGAQHQTESDQLPTNRNTNLKPITFGATKM
jgi:hypothetical protein